MNAPEPGLAHSLDQSVEALSDVLGAIRACERQLLDPGGDPADVMTGTARVLAVVGRLLEFELAELEKLVGGGT